MDFLSNVTLSISLVAVFCGLFGWLLSNIIKRILYIENKCIKYLLVALSFITVFFLDYLFISAVL
ncbi:hypothetical protein KHQ82_10660 [Mycoplasmatota bacterium]|nr:hypothetical protein KHQ82_10660 [Mycoplasmatota bacterium]